MFLLELAAGLIGGFFLGFIVSIPLNLFFSGLTERDKGLIFVGIWFGIGALSFVGFGSESVSKPISDWLIIGIIGGLGVVAYQFLTKHD